MTILMICVLSIVGYIIGGIITFLVMSYITVSYKIDKNGQLKIDEELDIKETAVAGCIWPVVLVLCLSSVPCRGLIWLAESLRKKKIKRINKQHRLRTLVTTGDE